MVLGVVEGKRSTDLLQYPPIGFQHSRSRRTKRVGPPYTEASLHFASIANFGAMECHTQPHIVIVTTREALVEEASPNYRGPPGYHGGNRNLTTFDDKSIEAGISFRGTTVHETPSMSQVSDHDAI